MAGQIKKIPFQPETNCVFHFTKEFETIIKIITDKAFKYSYSAEYFFENKYRKIGVPCVCFSSRPLSKLKYMASYGEWGIGLTKDWARKHKLNPVFYLEKSKIAENLKEASKAAIKEINKYKNSPAIPIHLIAWMNYESSLLYNTKISRGPNKKAGKNKYPFFEEREWRSYLDLRDFNGDWTKLNIIVEKDWETKKRELNESISHFKLEFELKDIEFIIAPEIEKLIIEINNSKSFQRSSEEERLELEILKSKITSYHILRNQVV